MAEGGGGPQHYKIRIWGHIGHPDFEENLQNFPLQEIGYISQDHDENETSVGTHSSEGAGKGEKCGKGSRKEGLLLLGL